MPARGRQAEAVLQQLVGEDDGFLQAALAERGVDQACEISFFFSALLMFENGRPLGRISDSSARPTVVSTSVVAGDELAACPCPCSYSVRRTAILAVISTCVVVERALHFGDVGEDHAFALAR